MRIAKNDVPERVNVPGAIARQELGTVVGEPRAELVEEDGFLASDEALDVGAEDVAQAGT